MRFFGDYHTHSYLSDGRQSMEEIVRAANERGLKEIAITDHGPMAAVIGVKDCSIYLEQKAQAAKLQEQYPDMRILVGAEANIRDLDGTLDIPEEVITELDLLIAGLHPYTIPTSVQDGMALWVQNSLRHLGKKQSHKALVANTEALIAAVENNPSLDIISHPGLFFAVDVKAVAEACSRHEVLFEINCGHNHPPISDIIEAEQTGVRFIINSDAHFQDTVGHLAYGSSLVEVLGLDAQRIVNHAAGGGIAAWGKTETRICTYSSSRGYREPARHR
ncbi:MAG: PHP domain-containing protein [Syntrophomonadaceae bacterium]|jgi:putative hydrolase|nr:PHP domain-containing protein [Syntrophomonadaceae bacterium]